MKKCISLIDSIDKDTKRLITITILVFITMSAIRPKLFLTTNNFTSMGFQIAELGFFSIAMMMVMVTGGIDLSIVGIANLSGIVAAFVLHNAFIKEVSGFTLALYIIMAVLASIIVGILCGCTNGLIISKFNVPPMLATLGTFNLYTGIAIILTKGEAIAMFPERFLAFGNETLFRIPIPLIFLIVALIVTAIIFNKTKYGFQLKFIGTNYKASLYTGMENKKVVVMTYIYSGVVSALIGLEVLARTDSAKADFGANYIFQAILCAVLGATNPEGGYAKVSCLALALMSLQFLSSGFSMLRLGGYFKEFTWGFIIIAALASNYFIEQRSLKRYLKVNN